MSKEHECTIGMWLDYDNTKLVTLSDLKDEIKTHNESCEYWAKENIYTFNDMKKIKLSDYCDKRRSHNLYNFNYCPYCGEKINWKKLKEAD